MLITDAGNVGIGTDAPTADLQIGAGASSSHGKMVISNDNGLQDVLRFTNGGGSDTHYPAGIWYQAGQRMELRCFSSSSASNAAQLVLASNGKVGIGSDSPDTYLLHLKKANTDTSITLGAETDNHLVIQNSDNGSNDAGRFAGMQFTINSNAAAGRAGIYCSYEGSGDTDLNFWTSEAGTKALAMTIDQGGNVTPGADNTQNLGSSSLRWANLYVADMHFSNEGKEGGNEVDGTTGDWTIQEGDENLFVLNRKTGKKFKMNLTEV